MLLLQKLIKLFSYFPNMEQWEADKIQYFLSDIFNDTLSIDGIKRFMVEFNALKALLQMPLIEQRSKEWFQLRENRLTASDLAQALGKGKFGNRNDLLAKKAFPASKPMDMIPPLKWGVMFEDMGMRCYKEANNNITIHDFGLIPHDTIDCFGASPDGITETCVMVEMKCPYRRKFNGEIPEQYYLQIQGQLATCKLTHCDYVECYMQAYDNISEYEILTQINDKHGIILECMKDGNYIYEYSPPQLTVQECIMWANQTFDRIKRENQLEFIKMTPWKLKHMFIKHVEFDPQLWNDCVPKIKEFWKDVLELRQKGLPSISPSPSNSFGSTTYLDQKKVKPKYVFIVDSDEES